MRATMRYKYTARGTLELRKGPRRRTNLEGVQALLTKVRSSPSESREAGQFVQAAAGMATSRGRQAACGVGTVEAGTGCPSPAEPARGLQGRPAEHGVPVQGLWVPWTGLWKGYGQAEAARSQRKHVLDPRLGQGSARCPRTHTANPVPGGSLPLTFLPQCPSSALYRQSFSPCPRF